MDATFSFMCVILHNMQILADIVVKEKDVTVLFSASNNGRRHIYIYVSIQFMLLRYI